MYKSSLRALNFINWNKFGFRIMYCPVCASIRPMVKLDDNEIAVRCLICRSSTVTMSLVSVLRRLVSDLDNKIVYESSSRGSLFRFLSKMSKTLFYSEFFENVPPGEYFQGIQCQDIQQLTYKSKSFDICTSTEVFEHVPDDHKGFSEIRRVLKNNGILVFTVPLSNRAETIERATITSAGKIKHYLPPKYHRDPIRKYKPVLVFRDYGQDIVDRLKSQGFMHAVIVDPVSEIPWRFKRSVVVAYRNKRGPS